MNTPQIDLERALKAAMRRVQVLTEENIVLEAMVDQLQANQAEPADEPLPPVE